MVRAIQVGHMHVPLQIVLKGLAVLGMTIEY